MKNTEKNKIPKRLLIIGNGFDLDLGRNTRFSDFAKSDFWPKNLKSQLYRYLSQKSQIEKWFDLNVGIIPIAYKFKTIDTVKCKDYDDLKNENL